MRFADKENGLVTNDCINILELDIILVSRVVLFLAVGSGLLVIRPHHLHGNNHNYRENRTNQHEENQDDLA